MKRKAFTLIELLVVIAVIALLATLMVPSFSNAMSVYRDTQCRNNLRRLSEGFVLASDSSLTGGVLDVSAPDDAGLYPTGMIWPSVPNNVVENIELFKCPEDEIKQSSVIGSLEGVEYESEFGNYPMDTIGNGNCYKSRRGRDDNGLYTEYIMQDDEGTGGQYAQMNFNGWIDTDGGCKIYDSGIIHVWKNIQTETPNPKPDWSGAHGCYPTGINTCGNTNKIRYMGEPSLGGNGKMQDARGQDFKLTQWGERMTNYGINTSAYKYDTGGGCIVLVDYQESRVELDDPISASELLLQSARHFERVNFLMADGAVDSKNPLEIDPLNNIEAWRP